MLKIRKALIALPAGAMLSAVCDDPLAAIDVPNLVRQAGDELVSTEPAGAAATFLIRRRADAPPAERD